MVGVPRGESAMQSPRDPKEQDRLETPRIIEMIQLDKLPKSNYNKNEIDEKESGVMQKSVTNVADKENMRLRVA